MYPLHKLHKVFIAKKQQQTARRQRNLHGSLLNLVMYRLAHEKKNHGFTPNLDFNPLPTRFNLTEFLPTGMHSESMQHIKGEANK